MGALRPVGERVGGTMEWFDDSWDDATPEVELEPGSDPEELWRSLIAEEAYPRYWSESVWSHGADHAAELAADHGADHGSEGGDLLFADRGAETQLGNELRLSELWGLCEMGGLAMGEFFELSALITEVHGIPGSLCADCAMLGRPNVDPNWALAATALCVAHLRFRLGHARIDGGTTRR